MTRAADAIIIGGGVTGVSTAFHLAGRGLRRVLVLERKFLAAGGTGRSVGIVRQLYPTRETTLMVVRSLAVFQDFREQVAGDSGYVQCGALIGVSPAMRPTLEKTLALQKTLGVTAEILEPEDLPRLFLEFQQLDSSIGKHYQGTGLGLALTRRIAQAQGGSVAVQSTPGKGSTFSIALPLIGKPIVVSDSDAADASVRTQSEAPGYGQPGAESERGFIPVGD